MNASTSPQGKERLSALAWLRLRVLPLALIVLAISATDATQDKVVNLKEITKENVAEAIQGDGASDKVDKISFEGKKAVPQFVMDRIIEVHPHVKFMSFCVEHVKKTRDSSDLFKIEDLNHLKELKTLEVKGKKAKAGEGNVFTPFDGLENVTEIILDNIICFSSGNSKYKDEHITAVTFRDCESFHLDEIVKYWPKVEYLTLSGGKGQNAYNFEELENLLKLKQLKVLDITNNDAHWIPDDFYEFLREFQTPVKIKKGNRINDCAGSVVIGGILLNDATLKELNVIDDNQSELGPRSDETPTAEDSRPSD